LRSPSETGQLFGPEPDRVAWLERIHQQSANVIQLSEPRRALALNAASLLRELYEDFVGPVQVPQPRRSSGRRGLQLSLEAEFRRRGLGDALEHNYPAAGAEVQE